MKSMIQKINFRMKKNKTEAQKAILLNQKYSANMRQLYSLLHQNKKLPKQKFIHALKNELEQLQSNMIEELQLYKPSENKHLERFLQNNNIPNSYSLISILEEKENQIQNLKQRLNQKKVVEQKQNCSNDRLQQVKLLKKHLEDQKERRSKYQNKIQKIKEQLEEQTKNLIQNKILNFDEQIQFRKLENQERLQETTAL